MRNKLKIVLLTLVSVGIIMGCRKSANSPNPNTSPGVHPSASQRIDPKAMAAAFTAKLKARYLAWAARQAIAKAGIEDFKTQRALHLSVQSRALSVQNIAPRQFFGVIHVPEDYPSLQAAVDNAAAGGKIIVDGTVQQSGNILVATPNLTIQGRDRSATINDSNGANSTDNLVITAPGVTVQNLILVNIAVQISDPATNVTLAGDSITNASIQNPSVITLSNSSRNTITDCSITGSGANDGATNAASGWSGQSGILVDSLSNNNEVNRCIASNLDFIGYNLIGSNNYVSHCKVINSVPSPLNYYENVGFGIFDFNSYNPVSTGNVFDDCNADNQAVGFALYTNDVTLKNCSVNNNPYYGIFTNSIKTTILNCAVNKCGSGIEAIASEIYLNGNFSFSPANNVTIIGCSANQCSFAGIEVFDTNFKIIGNIANGCGATSGQFGAAGIFVSDAPASYDPQVWSGTLRDNITNSNLYDGIFLTINNNSNTTVQTNRAQHNGQCDFDEYECIGPITLINNQFGSTCNQF